MSSVLDVHDMTFLIRPERVSIHSFLLILWSRIPRMGNFSCHLVQNILIICYMNEFSYNIYICRVYHLVKHRDGFYLNDDDDDMINLKCFNYSYYSLMCQRSF